MNLRRLPLCGLVLAVGLLLGLVPTAGRAEPLSGSDIAGGWLNLYDGGLFGWNATGVWQNTPSILSAPPGADRRILYALPFGDFELRFLFRVSQKNSSAALRLRTTADGNPVEAGFRIPLGDADTRWTSGSIVNKAHATASLSAGQWHIVSVDASGGHVTVRMDGQQTASTGDGGVRSGYLGFENKADAGLDVRDIHLLPKGTDRLFNGTDLAGWKNVPFEKAASGGVFHPVTKIFGGGGPPKPHLAQWSVNGGRIVGAKGPGALETTGSYQDFVLQVTASAKQKKNGGFPAFYIRNDAGKMFTGYAIGIGPETGRVEGLGQPRRPLQPQEERSETLVAAGRQFGIFVDGTLVTLTTDTRPDGTSEKQGAKTAAGVLSLSSLEGDDQVGYRSIALAQLPKPFGKIVQPEPVVQPTVTPIAGPVTPTLPDAKKDNEELAKALGVMSPKDRAHVASLMSAAVRSSNPEEQMSLYNQVIEVDPNNTNAVQGYKDAQAKHDAQVSAAAEAAKNHETAQASEQSTQQQVADAQGKAQAAFLSGNLREADRALSVAERLAPGNPVSLLLRSRISSAFTLRSRLTYLGSGTGIILLIGSFWLWRSRRRSQRFPVLEMTRGAEEGRTFPVEKDIIRIGAVAQDGGQRNDIVIEDVEHMISRFHCELHRKDGRFFLIDCDSSNGTKIDGRVASPRTPVSVRKGSRIDLAGTAELRLGFDRRSKT